MSHFPFCVEVFSRYDRTAKAKAEKLYAAITDKKHGVLSWIKARW